MTEHPLLTECKRAMPKETWEHPLGRPPRAVRMAMVLQVESAEVRHGKTTHWFVRAIERASDFVQRCAGHKLVGQTAFASGATLPEVMEEAAGKLAAALGAEARP